MRNNTFLISMALASALTTTTPVRGATFGKVVTTVGGHPADIALDESRGKLYIANFTACEIDVMSTDSNTIVSSMNLGSPSTCNHPAALALSPDSRYLVVATYQNGVSTPTGGDLIVVIDLNSNTRQQFAAGSSPLGVAFVNSGAPSGQALIATASGFYLL